MRKCLILLFALTAGAAHSGPAWRWVDANGQVHYSDQPVPGATQIELSGAQSFGGAQRPTTATADKTAGQASTKATRRDETYQTFNIVSPKQQETLWNVGTVVNVQVQLEPPLLPGHLLDVYVDGQRRNLNVAGSELTIEDIYRGVHTIQAVVVDGAGAEVIRSLATTFMVQQSSIQNPNNPNSPNRPQPKAKP